jgi:hypothetical protein
MTVKSIITHDVAVRAYKTLVQVVAAQAIVYGSLQGSDAPPVQQTAAVSLGATLVAVLWNLALAWFTKTKDARLDKLAAAIDAIVDARLHEQGVPDDDTAPATPPAAPVAPEAEVPPAS